MNDHIQVGDEQFEVRETRRPDDTYQYDFAWLNGPASGTYGFSVGGGALTGEALEQCARGFVASFFSPDGIGPADFPDFVEARRAADNC